MRRRFVELGYPDRRNILERTVVQLLRLKLRFERASRLPDFFRLRSRHQAKAAEMRFAFSCGKVSHS
jgi:hypothetical protein